MDGIGKPKALVRITWALVWICVRMLALVLRPILRLPRKLRWLQVLLVLAFVVVFFHRPAIAYYWFWGSAILELVLLLVTWEPMRRLWRALTAR